MDFINNVILATLHVLWAWVVQNPAYSAPIIGAIFTEIFKPRTAVQYASIAARNPVWFFSRWVAFLQLVAAVFPDPVKARKIILKVIFGSGYNGGDGPANPAVVASEAPTKRDVSERTSLAAKAHLEIRKRLSLRRFSMFASVVTLFVVGCTKQQLLGGGDLLMNKALCALQYSDLPPAQIIEKCAVQPGDVERVLDLVRKHNEEVASKVSAAREKAGCSGGEHVRDGGL